MIPFIASVLLLLNLAGVFLWTMATGHWPEAGLTALLLIILMGK